MHRSFPERAPQRRFAPAKTSTPSNTETDPRLDPRIKKFFSAMPTPVDRHGVELLPAICRYIAHSTASDIADFAITSAGFKQES
jgi:hypothetical protein